MRVELGELTDIVNDNSSEVTKAASLHADAKTSGRCRPRFSTSMTFSASSITVKSREAIIDSKKFGDCTTKAG